MANIQIVTDSTAYLTREAAQRMNIQVVPLSVHFGGETMDEGFPGEFQAFYQRLKHSEEFPTTSQPPVGAFASVYEKALEEGSEVLTMVFSSKLSGTYNSAVTAANMIDPDKITVIDTETAVANLKFLLERAYDLAQEGKSRDEIARVIIEEKARTGVRLTVDNLEYLKKGGRLSGAQAFIGSLLNIKPILALEEGRLVPAGKARGKNKALEMMISDIPANVKKISVLHVINEEEAQKLKEYLAGRFEGVPIDIDELGPVIGAHLGPKAFGVCYKWE